MAKKKVDPFAGIELGFSDKSETMPPRQKVNLQFVEFRGEPGGLVPLDKTTVLEADAFSLTYDPESSGKPLLLRETLRRDPKTGEWAVPLTSNVFAHYQDGFFISPSILIRLADELKKKGYK